MDKNYAALQKEQLAPLFADMNEASRGNRSVLDRSLRSYRLPSSWSAQWRMGSVIYGAGN